MKYLSDPVHRLVVIALLMATGSALYVPFLNNPFIFDDVNLFYTPLLTQAATTPWELGTRGLPYFTLGWVQTQIGTLSAHRWLSLALHVCVGYQLFGFLKELLSAGGEHPSATAIASSTSSRWVAAIVALAFIVHPVAVYGAGYLVQRSTVLATLFALLCLRSLLTALRDADYKRCGLAAFWASLAILCKEHYVVVPVASLSLLLLMRFDQARIRVAGVFLVLCVPAMTLGLVTGLYAIGHAYEPMINQLEAERYSLPAIATPYERWLFSASTQAQLYFQYWLQWLTPSTDRMSIDLRVDFRRSWGHAQAWSWLVAWALLPLLACGVALWHRRLGVFALAFVFTAILFVVELGTVRLQEPYVLYRSYLWAIGYSTLAAAVIARIPRNAGLAFGALLLPLLYVQAQDRLGSLQNPLALWSDAVAKLPNPQVAGASRIFFNRGRAHFASGNIADAESDINAAIHLAPVNGRYLIARAAVFMSTGRPALALQDLDAGSQWLPDDEQLLFARFRALRALNRPEEAEAALLKAAELGSFAAKMELARRRSPTGDVTVDMHAKP